MLLLMFSMAGVPPTVGFYAKLAVLQAVVNAGYVWLAVVAVLFSLIGAFYYLRLVKLMYFDAPDGHRADRAARRRARADERERARHAVVRHPPRAADGAVPRRDPGVAVERQPAGRRLRAGSPGGCPAPLTAHRSRVSSNDRQRIRFHRAHARPRRPSTSGGLLHVLEDEVRLPDGKTARREYIRHPGAVVMIPLLDDGDGDPRAAVPLSACGAISTSCRRARSRRARSRCRPRSASCGRSAATRRADWRHLTTLASLHRLFRRADRALPRARPDPRRATRWTRASSWRNDPAPAAGARLGEDRQDHRREDDHRPAVGRQAALSSQDSGFGIRMELQVRAFSRSAASTRIWTMSRSSAKSIRCTRRRAAASPFDDRGC